MTNDSVSVTKSVGYPHFLFVDIFLSGDYTVAICGARASRPARCKEVTIMSDNTRLLLLYDSDETYTSRLLEYLARQKEPVLRGRAFHDPEALYSALKTHPDAVLLAEEALLPTLPENALSLAEGRIFLLAESTTDRGAPLPRLCRYQPASSLLRDLFSAEIAGDAAPADDTAGGILGIYAPQDTALRPAASWLLASFLAEHAPVLYIPLDPFRDLPLPQVSDTDLGVSDLLYRRRNRGDDYWSEDLLRRQEQLAWLPSAQNPEDVWQLSPEEAASLLRNIKRRSAFRFIITDLPCGRDPRPVLTACRQVLLLAENTPDGRRSLRSFREYMLLQEQEELLSRTHELILPPAPELASCAFTDPMLRHAPLGRMLKKEADLLLPLS